MFKYVEVIYVIHLRAECLQKNAECEPYLSLNSYLCKILRKYKFIRLIYMNKKHKMITAAVVFSAIMPWAACAQRSTQNFNGGWLLHLGDDSTFCTVDADDAAWQSITLPRAWNESEAFRVGIAQLSDSVAWYRKHFTITATAGRRFYLEFEGARWAAEVWVNGRRAALSENGVMAFGIDITPYVKEGMNTVAVRTDNSWTYRERATGQRFQWNDKNFNANYGGLPKNVLLHVMPEVHHTLPLYSSLGTTGTYVYGSDYDIPAHTMTLNVEAQVSNDGSTPVTVAHEADVFDAGGKKIGSVKGSSRTIAPHDTVTMTLSGKLTGIHFWSWGYGYLYDVVSKLTGSNGLADADTIRTGFRKTEFRNGMVSLNDRVIIMHGYAQRTSNEWPAVGMSVPAWMSDYSNGLMVESGGNIVRWMHVTPWKQDIESCDRVGLPEAMPAGDAEKESHGRQWQQRLELMRDAIVYNRNNPSIIFYECGNKGIGGEHMNEMKAIRDEYDPHGGRAIGCREMLDRPEAEYGGEMLYVNKSSAKPMWQMEYYRDEGLRKYWDNWSWPYHKEGDGPLYRGKPAVEYNHNMDAFACGQVKAWYDYWLERPGTGRRVNGGGAKIVFSDTNTHWRGEANYRSSGVTDAMRIPKDAFYAMQVMWDGWVTPEHDHTHIVGHWNYPAGTVKPVYVVSNADEVELFLNGRSLGRRTPDYKYLFTFNDIRYAAGTLTAVGLRNGREVSRQELVTAGKPHHIKITAIENPEGFKADGADMVIVQAEIADSAGRRVPLDNRMLHFSVSGEGEYLGGIARPAGRQNGTAEAGSNSTNGKEGMLDGPATVSAFDNYIGSRDLPVECGVNRVLLRSTTHAGNITLTVTADSLPAAIKTLTTMPVDIAGYLPKRSLRGRLTRGETPAAPSYRDSRLTADIAGVTAGSNAGTARNSCDDNEASEWRSDGKKENAWITYHFNGKERVDEIAVKMTGWRTKYYPLAIYEDTKKVWEGITYPTLGYVHITIAKPVKASSLTIRMTGPATDFKPAGDTTELAGGKASNFDNVKSGKGKTELRIVEADLLKKL